MRCSGVGKMARIDKKTLVEELTNNWKRALADYQNLEKRYEKEKADFVQFANADLILKLLPTGGLLEKVAEHLKDDGLNLVVREFRRILSEEGLKEIKSLGESFDPLTMEAVEIVSGGEKNKVAEVLQKGYFLKGKVLLPAKVKVFGGKPEGKPPVKVN